MFNLIRNEKTKIQIKLKDLSKDVNKSNVHLDFSIYKNCNICISLLRLFSLKHFDNDIQVGDAKFQPVNTK